MRLLLTFIIFILGGFYTFGDNNCCEQCCEYLENCCKKGKGNKKENKKEEEEEVLEKFYLKKSEAANLEEIKKLVSPEWYSKKGEETSFILYEKIDGVENQDLNKNDGIKITKDKNGFSIEGNFIIESSDLSGIFKSCKHISISVIACDTSGVTKMYYMFYNCTSLQQLDLSNFNTENVKNMSVMFCDCSSLTELDLSNFNTENVKDMSGMFYDCSSLTKLNLSNFNTENVKDMSGMFSGCSSLTELDLSNFNTKNVTNTSGMFSSIPDKNFNSFTFPTSWNMIDE